jgi:cytochrome c5
MLGLAVLLSTAVVSGSGNPSNSGSADALSELARRYAAAYATRSFASAHRSIPAWARKYNVNCSACHSPAMPRLNEAGERFKWAGYRMPEEIGEVSEVMKVQNYLAAGASAQYEYDKTEDAPTSTSAFSLPAITVFYAGPFGGNFSGFFELEHGSEGEIERIAQVSGLWGKQDSYGGLRLGQMHYLAEWGLAGFDRPIGISTPLPVDAPLTGSVPFAFGEHQLGAEAYYVRGGNRLSAQVLNGVNAEGEGAVADADTRKDFLITDQLLIDSAGSGVQGVAYYGTITGLDASAPDLNSHFWRLGVTANKVIRDFEVLGALIYGKDQDLPVGGISPFGASETKAIGTWVSGQYTFSRAAETPLTVFGRFEYADPDTDVSDDANRRIVLGTVLPLNVPQYLRWALEYRRDMPQGGLSKTNNITTEIWLNF